MNVIHATADLESGGRPVCVAVGVFDGVHLGHQRVLQQTIADAASVNGISVVVTFDRHPNAIVAPSNVPPLIYPLNKKLEVFAFLGLNTVCVIRFDKDFSQISGEKFVGDLVRDFGSVRSISVGANFMFGSRRSGNVALLEAQGAKLGFTVHAAPDVDAAGKPVSSTRIRDAVRAGDFGFASQMLGRAYTLCGPVIRGQRLGRKLGFPTANMDVAGILVPPAGVYVADAMVGADRPRAAVNIGHRPSIQPNDPEIHVEAHLLDFNGEIAGQDLELTFLKKLREERKFLSLEALQAQIAQDILEARKF